MKTATRQAEGLTLSIPSEALEAIAQRTAEIMRDRAGEEHSPWLTLDNVKAKGALVVWPATDTAGAPPPALKERFPDLVADVPRAFEGQVPLDAHRKAARSTSQQ